jgi:hypothetical protein
MLCSHIWIRQEITPLNISGTEATSYTHRCPRCGKIKTTLRTKGKMPPPILWKRELQKLLLRARSDGYQITFQDVPLTLDKISVRAL